MLRMQSSVMDTTSTSTKGDFVTRLPSDLFELVIDYLTANEAHLLSQVKKEWHPVVTNKPYWEKRLFDRYLNKINTEFKCENPTILVHRFESINKNNPILLKLVKTLVLDDALSLQQGLIYPPVFYKKSDGFTENSDAELDKRYLSEACDADNEDYIRDYTVKYGAEYHDLSPVLNHALQTANNKMVNLLSELNPNLLHENRVKYAIKSRRLKTVENIVLAHSINRHESHIQYFIKITISLDAVDIYEYLIKKFNITEDVLDRINMLSSAPNIFKRFIANSPLCNSWLKRFAFGIVLSGNVTFFHEFEEMTREKIDLPINDQQNTVSRYALESNNPDMIRLVTLRGISFDHVNWDYQLHRALESANRDMVHYILSPEGGNFEYKPDDTSYMESAFKSNDIEFCHWAIADIPKGLGLRVGNSLPDLKYDTENFLGNLPTLNMAWELANPKGKFKLTNPNERNSWVKSCKRHSLGYRFFNLFTQSRQLQQAEIHEEPPAFQSF